jgi:hypothetical protein
MWIEYSNTVPSPLSAVPTLILQQTVLATSLISATVPNLKAFLQSFSVNWGDAGFGSGSATKTYGNGTFEMNNLNSRVASASRSAANNLYSSRNPPDFEAKITTSRRLPGERDSLGSGGSQDLIIRKETAWTVERS